MLSPGDMVGEYAFMTGELRHAMGNNLDLLAVLRLDHQLFAWLRLESAKVCALSDSLGHLAPRTIEPMAIPR